MGLINPNYYLAVAIRYLLKHRAHWPASGSPAKLTRAPGNDFPIEGLKVVTASGWFAAGPSGTENIYKIYAESFKDHAHLDAIVSEAQEIVNNALDSAQR